MLYSPLFIKHKNKLLPSFFCVFFKVWEKYCVIFYCSLWTCTAPPRLGSMTCSVTSGSGLRITSTACQDTKVTGCTMTSPPPALMADTTWSWYRLELEFQHSHKCTLLTLWFLTLWFLDWIEASRKIKWNDPLWRIWRKNEELYPAVTAEST